MQANQSKGLVGTDRPFDACVRLLTYALMRFMNLPLPTTCYPIQAAPVLLPAFFIVALGEELGWSGYVIDPRAHDRRGKLIGRRVDRPGREPDHQIPIIFCF